MANLEFRATYFKCHNEAWDEFSEELKILQSDFIDAKPAGAALFATFLFGWKSSYERVQETIETSLLGRGITATKTVGDKLEDSCRTYIHMEAKNAAEADAILASVGY